MAADQSGFVFKDIAAGTSTDLNSCEITLIGTDGRRFSFEANSNGVHHLCRGLFLLQAKMDKRHAGRVDPAGPGMVLEVKSATVMMDKAVGDARIVFKTNIGADVHIPVGPKFAQQIADGAAQIVEFYRQQAANPPTRN